MEQQNNREDLQALIDHIRTYLHENDGGDYSKWHELIEGFIQTYGRDNIPEEIQTELEQLPNIAAIRTKNVDFALDKINTSWKLFAEEETDGQLAFRFDTTAADKSKQALILFSIDFADFEDNVRITRKLLPFDQRVYIAVDALFKAGNDIITVQQIYAAMGKNGTAGKSDKEKIDEAMTKLMAAHITIDNTQEIQANYKYPHVVVDTQMLNIKRVRAIVNGQLVDSAYQLLDEPVLMSFARGRKQVTTIDRKLLASPLSATSENILIEDYLIERISKAASGHGKKTILLNTLYEQANISTTNRTKKHRANEKVKKLLDFYKEQQFIKGYDLDNEKITLKV